ncbi:TetR/AcrR family transcriptional regulator [uncultured Enterovirga sp.]|uniref:TetR/AcrR family transcriptional regulator n=1 Tax=uncultured Enterovirga sp. TaxID=2026352 RepID=UPI0035CA7585
MSSQITERPTQNAELSGTRCAILRIAEKLFREIGYRKTTVADIAKTLRMSPANVYRFFESKKAINEAVADRIMFELEAELSAIALRPGVSATDRLAEFLRALNRLSTERFTTERRMHEMVEVAMAESWQVVHRHIACVDEMLCRLVDEGARSGEFQVDDAPVAARCVHAAMVRFCHPGLIVQCAEEPGPALEDMVSFLLRSLNGGRPSA